MQASVYLLPLNRLMTHAPIFSTMLGANGSALSNARGRPTLHLALTLALAVLTLTLTLALTLTLSLSLTLTLTLTPTRWSSGRCWPSAST